MSACPFPRRGESYCGRGWTADEDSTEAPEERRESGTPGIALGA